MTTSTRGTGTWLRVLLVASAISIASIPASAQTRRGVGVTVYTNPNFSGQSATFNNDTPSLVPYGLNDKISSIQVPPGETWEICQDINYQNRCQTISGSISDLRTMGWNDTISSLRLVRGFQGRRSNGYPNDGYGQGNYGYGQGQGLVIYDRPGFRGNSRTITSTNSNVGGRSGSLLVQGGGTWEVCDRTGRCATVTQNVSDLSQLGLNGLITSARLISNDRRGNNGRGWARGRQDRNYRY